MLRRALGVGAACLGTAACGGSVTLAVQTTPPTASATATAQVSAATAEYTATTNAESSSSASSASTAAASDDRQRFTLDPATPSTWPDACRVLTAAQVVAVDPGTYEQTSSHAQILGGGSAPNATECKYASEQAAFFTWTLQYVKSSASDAHSSVAGDVSGASPVPGIGDEAYYDPLGELEVRQGSTVWILSAIEADKMQQKADAIALARVIAAEFTG
ncbi:MAG TPA: hypothetical protein VFO60_08315 [Candidatus Dormibacteraeota bacterium]|nr:hypothetical protein [Candidatus Dormibacteraeota bacterium]